MLNKKRKGFTIVELVIVIAVIAILAAVLIPTFASIIDRANQSADIQAVRQMNIELAAESVEKKPETVGEVVDILANAGFNSREKLVPVSAGHGFYWCATENMITLIRDEGENIPELIFPTEETAVNTAFEAAKTNFSAINFGADKAVASNDRTFFDLEPAGEDADLPSDGSEGSGESGESGGSGGDTTVHVTGVSLGPTTATLNIGDTVPLTATVEPTDATNKNVTWSTSAPTVATVDNGVVTAKAEGVAVIIVATEDGGKMATCTVTVNGSGANNEAPTGTAVGTEEALISALNAGGDCQLTGDITLDSAITVTGTSKIHLNGYTLKLKDPSGTTSDVISVSGKLTITNGNVVVESVDENQASYSNKRGIYVSSGGTLELKNVHVDGNRPWNIENDGTVSLTGVNFTVNDGFGLANSGTATILRGTFISNGQDVAPIYNEGGTVRITKTVFSEGNGFASYYSIAPIVSAGGAITLNGVTVTTSTDTSDYAAEGANICNAYVSDGGVITIESGTFNGPFACVEYSTITIKGGTFSGKTLSDLETVDAMKQALCYYPANSDWQVTYESGICTLTKS